MPDPAAATEVHQALDVHRYLTPQIALHRVPADLAAQGIELPLGEVLDLGLRRYPGRTEILSARLRPIPKMWVSAIAVCLWMGMLTRATRAIFVVPN